MMIDNYIEQFDKYHLGQLSMVERQDFEKKLLEDEEVKVAFERYQQTIAGIEAFERQQLKQQLLNAQPQRSTGKVRRMAGHWGRIAAAASLALLVSVGIYWCNQSNDRLFAAYDLDKAENLMGFGNDQAIDERQMFQVALTFKDDNDMEAAIASFQKISDKDYHLYFKAQYNMALLYLKKDDKATTRTILQKLSQRPENHYLKTKASAMLKDLDKFCYY
jgi:hypothetical protein